MQRLLFVVTTCSALSLTAGCGLESDPQSDNAPIPGLVSPNLNQPLHISPLSDDAPLATLNELRDKADRFITKAAAAGIAEGWQDARSTDAIPLYRPDVQGPAYYEFHVDVGGFLILSTGQHDSPITNWSTSAPGPSEYLTDRALSDGLEAVTFYKLDVYSYAAEDDRGELVARLGQLPAPIAKTAKTENTDNTSYLTTMTAKVDAEGKLVGTEMVREIVSGPRDGEVLERVLLDDTDSVDTLRKVPRVQTKSFASWAELKQSYAQTFSKELSKQRDVVRGHWATSKSSEWQCITYTATGDATAQRKYDQRNYWNGCREGCTPVAWAMLFSWADERGHAKDPLWTPYTDIYLHGMQGQVYSPERPPEFRGLSADVGDMIYELRTRMGTDCGGFTDWHNIGLGGYYVVQREPQLGTAFLHGGIHTERVIDLIANWGYPAHITSQYLTGVMHSMVAYGTILCWAPTNVAFFMVNNGFGNLENMVAHANGVGWIVNGGPMP